MQIQTEMTQDAEPASNLTPSAIADQLAANGYKPVPCAGKRPVHNGWPERDFTGQDFGPTSSVGIKTGGGVALVDIDITDPDIAAAVVAEWERRHKGALRRTGKAPKTSFLIACDIPAKREVKLADPKQKVEILAKGQQFIAYGIHPDTGKPYRWHGTDPLDDFIGPADMQFPVSEAELTDFLDWVTREHGPKGAVGPLARQAQLSIATHSVNTATTGLDEVGEVLGHVSPDVGYSEWLNVLMALHEHTGGGADGLALAEEWSARGAKHKPGEVASKWKGFKPGGGVTLGTIYALSGLSKPEIAKIKGRHEEPVTHHEFEDVSDGNKDHNQALELIALEKGKTVNATNQTLALMRKDPVTFDFGGDLAIVDGGTMRTLCEHRLSHHLGHIIQYYKFRKVKDGYVQEDADPPVPLLKQVLALGEGRKLKPLKAVTTAPIIRVDGSLVTEQGYDKKTQLFLDTQGKAVQSIPLRPTKEQTLEALDTLMQPFSGFPFVDADARGAMLAALLTAAVRPILPTAPAFAFDAPIQGSGKTLLAKCVAAMATGRDVELLPHTHSRDDEEPRKRLFSAIRTGTGALIWDNIIGTFDSASLAAYMTSEMVSDRVLGKSEMVTVPNKALVLLSGNNLSIAGDLARRVIICRIDPETDRPFARRFDLNPLEHMLEHRREMVTAALTLIRGRFASKAPLAEGDTASFEGWDKLVRQTVAWIGAIVAPGQYSDPMGLISKAVAEDPEAETLHSLISALGATFGSREFSAKDVMGKCDGFGTDELRDAVVDVAGDRAVASSRSIGRVLKFREGRIVQGIRLQSRRDSVSKILLYRVVSAG